MRDLLSLSGSDVVVIADDSSSMNSIAEPESGLTATRWDELRNALSTSAYLPSRTAAPQAHECHQVLLAFFASPSLPQLVTALLVRALPLSSDEYDEYEADPEAFVYEEHLARESESLRKCAEKCLLTLADTTIKS